MAEEEYEAALRLVTGPDKVSEWGRDERSEMPPVSEPERLACERWLRLVGFLVPGEDDETWNRIRKNWISFLSVTGIAPQEALCPDRKQFPKPHHPIMPEAWGPRQELAYFASPRVQRHRTQERFYQDVDDMGALLERWPPPACALVTRCFDGPSAGKEEVSKLVQGGLRLGRRQWIQAIWTGFMAFLVDSFKEGSLKEMGLDLDEDQIETLWTLFPETWGPWYRGPKKMPVLLTEMILQDAPTPSRNPILWWTAILVRSAISGPDERPDYISRGMFLDNIIRMELGIKERIDAIRYHSKLFFLDHAFSSWKASPEWRQEVQKDLDAADLKSLRAKRDERPDPRLDERTCSSEAWQDMLGHLQREGERWVDPSKNGVMHQIDCLYKWLEAARAEEVLTLSVRPKVSVENSPPDM